LSTITSTPSISNVWFSFAQQAFNNTEHKRMLVMLRYLELGLLPPNASDMTFAFDNSGNDKTIDAALASMTPEDRRKATRKFRKMVRRLAKRPYEKKRAARRSAVYSAIWRIVSNEIDPKLDLDDAWEWAAKI
jgi:hypothetical protein